MPKNRQTSINPELILIKGTHTHTAGTKTKKGNSTRIEIQNKDLLGHV